MAPVELWELTAAEIAERVRRREVSAEEVWRAFEERIVRVEPVVHAYITLNSVSGLMQAREIDRRIAAGEEVGPLAGVPVAVKDNICTADLRTTCASKMLADFVPPYDATVVARLKAAGAVIIGKANLDEFAMGSSVENSRFFQTYNPWDLTRVPGGSSGGSAAAVAAGEAAFALGSDTGGSVRQPAAFCGIVGLKPTYGLVSRYGLVAFASSLDQVGPMTRDVRDAALTLETLAGHDPLDSTSAPGASRRYTAALTGDIRGLRVGVPKEYFGSGSEPGVERAVRAAIDRLAELGATIEECSLPHTEYGLPAYYIIAPAEASANLARYDGVRYGYRAEDARTLEEMYCRTRAEGFGSEVKRRIMIGTYALSAGYYDAYYLKAQKVRTLVRRDFDAAFARFDVLVTPTSPTVAFKVGERAANPLAMYLSDVFAVSANLAGLPALSVPCGLVDGLPVGLQFIGPAFGEEVILRAAHAYEQASGGAQLRPSLEVR